MTILVFLLLFPLIQSHVFACECFGNSDYTEIFDSSEFVFVGTVNDIVANGENPKVSVTFDVHSIAKGELAHSQVTTSTWLSDCSVDYEIGTTYVVAINDKEILSTDRCSTKPLEIMSHYEVIPHQLLSAMTEPEVPDNNNTQKTSEIITSFGDIKISNTKSIQWTNLREELVMIHTTSVEKLFERGYLIDRELYLQQRNNHNIKTFDPTYQTQPMTKAESQFLYPPSPNNYFDIPEMKSKPEIPPNAGPLAGVHEHASILVPIFGDNLDFSKSMFQIKNPYIHFEGNDGTTIHKHAENVTLGFLFETLNMELTDECLTIPDGRYFCNEETDGFSLKFYINGEKVESLHEYVITDNDRILISYGFENNGDEINSQIDELNSQMIVS